MFKKIMLGLASFALAMSPLAVKADQTVKIESVTKVANVTAGDTSYKNSVSAKVDEVVKVQVWYHNMENADSGKVANNLKVNIKLPSAKGKNQTITGVVSAANSNTVTQTSTVNLSLDQAFLEYIPGSAVWRHNTGTNANPNWVNTKISDDVVNGGVVLENAKPCFNFEASVTILARVKASAVSINKQVRTLGDSTWVKQNTAKAGDTVEYLITFKNEGNTVLKNVAVGDNMPAFVTYVPGSTMLKNGANPSGIKITSDNITKGGIDVGNYNPGAVGYVWFKAKIKENLAADCYTFTNVGVVRPKGMNEFYNTAKTSVCVKPVVTPALECVSLVAHPASGLAPLKVNFTAKGNAKNTTITKFIFDFGDGSAKLTTANPNVSHTYTKLGTYTAKVSVTNNKLTKTSSACQVTIKVTSKPNEEQPPEEENIVTPTGETPEAGPETAMLGVFGTGAMGYGIRYWLRSRKALAAALLNKK